MKNFNEYMDKTNGLGEEITEKAIEAYKKSNSISDDSLKAMNYVGGYIGTGLSIFIYIQHIYPLLKKLKKYLLTTVISLILLLFSFMLL